MEYQKAKKKLFSGCGLFPLGIYIFRMKTIYQYNIAKWIGVKPPTLSNWFCDNKGLSKDSIKVLREKTGLSSDEIIDSNGNQLREKVYAAYRHAHGIE